MSNIQQATACYAQRRLTRAYGCLPEVTVTDRALRARPMSNLTFRTFVVFIASLQSCAASSQSLQLKRPFFEPSQVITPEGARLFRGRQESLRHCAGADRVRTRTARCGTSAVNSGYAGPSAGRARRENANTSRVSTAVQPRPLHPGQYSRHNHCRTLDRARATPDRWPRRRVR